MCGLNLGAKFAGSYTQKYCLYIFTYTNCYVVYQMFSLLYTSMKNTLRFIVSYWGSFCFRGTLNKTSTAMFTLASLPQLQRRFCCLLHEVVLFLLWSEYVITFYLIWSHSYLFHACIVQNPIPHYSYPSLWAFDTWYIRLENVSFYVNKTHEFFFASRSRLFTRLVAQAFVAPFFR